MDISLLKLITHGQTKGNGGVLFFKNIINIIRYGKSKSKDPLVMKFFGWHAKTRSFSLPQAKKEGLDAQQLTSCIDELARELDTAFSGLVIGKVDILKEKIISKDPRLAQKIKEIEDGSASATEAFYRINQLIETPKDRFRYCPKSGYSDSFVTLTSESLNRLFELGIDNNDKGAVLERLFGNDFGRTRRVKKLADCTHPNAMNNLVLI
jgi:hypothetical protein